MVFRAQLIRQAVREVLPEIQEVVSRRIGL